MPVPRITVPLDDPRITRYLTHWTDWPESEDDARHDIARLISDFEAAGLTVIDPDDEALDRAVDAWFNMAYTDLFDDDLDKVWRARMRAAITALRDGA